MMAKWNWGGRDYQGASPNGDRATQASPEAPKGSSPFGEYPLRVVLAIIEEQRQAFKDPAYAGNVRGAAFGEMFACQEIKDAILRDSRLKREAPRRETGSAPQGAKAAVPSGNRPENPAYFWLGIQAEGRE